MSKEAAIRYLQKCRREEAEVSDQEVTSMLIEMGFWFLVAMVLYLLIPK